MCQLSIIYCFHAVYIYIHIFCKYVIQNKNQAWYFFRNIYSYYQTLWISTFADIYFHKLTDVFFCGYIVAIFRENWGIYIYMYTYQSTGTVFFSHYVDIGIDVTRFTRSNTNMRIDIIIYYIRVIPHIQVDYDLFSNHCTLHV